MDEIHQAAALIGLNIPRGCDHQCRPNLRLIDAAQMHACGFLTHLVPPEDLQTTADTLTQTLADMAPLALLGMKKHLNRIARGSLDEADLQRDIARAQQSADLREGAAAWDEKRLPRFTGH